MGSKTTPYHGYYSNKKREIRKEEASASDLTVLAKSSDENSNLSKSHWAQMIKKVYEVDLLDCPNCHQTMLIISCIDQGNIIYTLKGTSQKIKPSWFIGKRLWLKRKPRTIS